MAHARLSNVKIGADRADNPSRTTEIALMLVTICSKARSAVLTGEKPSDELADGVHCRSLGTSIAGDMSTAGGMPTAV